MAISPSTTVYLCGIPLDITQKNQLHFTTALAQQQYFAANVKHSYANPDYTYVRKDSVIKVSANVDALYDSNYVMYQNANYGAKWFYAFITKMEYINDNVTAIHIKTDVYQTWLFDTQVKPSFVVREHLSSAQDYVGANLVDEALETGDYVFNSLSFSGAMGTPVVIIGSTIDSGLLAQGGDLCSWVYNGVGYYAFNFLELEAINGFLINVANAGKADAITSVFMFPGGFLDTFVSGDKLGIASGISQTVTTSKNLTDINGYAPKNKKLFTYPYNLLYVSNQNGNKAELHYEYFSGESCQFHLAANIAPSPTIICVPENYKGIPMCYEEMLTVSGFPLCNWTYDAFKNWLAQNGVSVALGIASSGVTLAGGIISSNPMAVASGMLGVAQSLGTVYQHSIQPPQAKGNTASSGAAYSLSMLDFGFMDCTITAQYAERIDNFFEMYGYKVNALKVPNLTSRPYWNYVKTIDVNIIGEIPQDDMEQLKKIYNDGVTLWHNPTYYCNYSVNNH